MQSLESLEIFAVIIASSLFIILPLQLAVSMLMWIKPLWLFAVALSVQNDLLFSSSVSKREKLKTNANTAPTQDPQLQDDECLAELFADLEGDK